MRSRLANSSSQGLHKEPRHIGHVMKSRGPRHLSVYEERSRRERESNELVMLRELRGTRRRTLQLYLSCTSSTCFSSCSKGHVPHNVHILSAYVMKRRLNLKAAPQDRRLHGFRGARCEANLSPHAENGQWTETYLIAISCKSKTRPLQQQMHKGCHPYLRGTGCLRLRNLNAHRTQSQYVSCLKSLRVALTMLDGTFKL